MANFELGNLIWRVKGDTADFDKRIGGSQTRFEKFGASARKIGANLTKFVTLPLAGIGIAATKAASDLGESLNAVSVVFGTASGTIEDFGETAADAAGLSQNSFNELATVIGAQLKQSGLDIDDVADRTVELTQRSADLASVFNVDVKEATGALGAALRGEAEPARRFGVNISDAAVQAEALASGLVETRGEITEQIKVQARYNLIMQQSEQVSGDFQNTSDSLANQTRILRADLENIGAELGQAFIPLVTDAVGAVRDAVSGFGDLDDGTKKLIVALGVIAAASGPVIGAIGALAKLKAAIIAINTTALFGPVGIIVGIAAVTAGLIGLGRARRQSQLEEIAEEFADVTSAAGLAVQEIEAIEDALRLGSMDGFTDAKEQVEALARNLGVSEAAVIDIGLASDNVTQRYKEQLQVLRDQITEQVALNSYQDSWISAANERAAADARAAEILRQRAEEEQRIAEAQQAIQDRANETYTNIERRLEEINRLESFNLAIGEEYNAEAARREAVLQEVNSLISAGIGLNTSFSGALGFIREQYGDILAVTKETADAEGELANAREERVEKTKQSIDEIREEEERLTALRLELFGTEEDQFRASLKARVEQYREYGLTIGEIDKFVKAEWDKFNEERIDDSDDLQMTQLEMYQQYQDARLAVHKDANDKIEADDEELAAQQVAIAVEALGVIGDQIADFVALSLNLRLQALSIEEQAVRDSADAQIAALEERYQRELELAGLAEDTAVEAARKKLEEAKKAGDQEAIDAAELALQKAEIDEKYAEERKEIERETAMELWRIEVEQFEAKKKLDQIEAAITTAQMAVNAYNALVGIPVVGPVLAPIAALAAVGFGLKQQQLIASQPSPPMPAFAMGGDFVTNGPQPIMVGDNPGGRERVTVEPLGSSGGGRPMQLIVNLDGRQIANSTVDYINNGVVRVEARA